MSSRLAQLDELSEQLRAAGIRWLCSNDPNGTYTDEDCEAEGDHVLPLADVLALVQSQLHQDLRVISP